MPQCHASHCAGCWQEATEMAWAEYRSLQYKEMLCYPHSGSSRNAFLKLSQLPRSEVHAGSTRRNSKYFLIFKKTVAVWGLSRISRVHCRSVWLPRCLHLLLAWVGFFFFFPEVIMPKHENRYGRATTRNILTDKSQQTFGCGYHTAAQTCRACQPRERQKARRNPAAGRAVGSRSHHGCSPGLCER